MLISNFALKNFESEYLLLLFTKKGKQNIENSKWTHRLASNGFYG